MVHLWLVSLVAALALVAADQLAPTGTLRASTLALM